MHIVVNQRQMVENSSKVHISSVFEPNKSCEFGVITLKQLNDVKIKFF
jgi:hypothetical protein